MNAEAPRTQWGSFHKNNMFSMKGGIKASMYFAGTKFTPAELSGDMTLHSCPIYLDAI